MPAVNSVSDFFPIKEKVKLHHKKDKHMHWCRSPVAWLRHAEPNISFFPSSLMSSQCSSPLAAHFQESCHFFFLFSFSHIYILVLHLFTSVWYWCVKSGSQGCTYAKYEHSSQAREHISQMCPMPFNTPLVWVCVVVSTPQTTWHAALTCMHPSLHTHTHTQICACTLCWDFMLLGFAVPGCHASGCHFTESFSWKLFRPSLCNMLCPWQWLVLSLEMCCKHRCNG